MTPVPSIIVAVAEFSALALFAGSAPTDAATVAAAVTSVVSLDETDPVAASGDAADDPAIWVDESNPARSLVLGNNKQGALESYDLSGNRVQRITTGVTFYGNVDVRGNTIAVAHQGVQIFTMNASTRTMLPATEGTAINTSGEGLCMYDKGRAGVADGLFVFTVTRAAGRVRQYELRDPDADGRLTGALVRDFTIGSESEGCVADDATGSLFISEEDKAVWRYGADAASGISRVRVASVDATALPADAEGVTIAGDYLLVSAQNALHPSQNFIAVFSKRPPYNRFGNVRIGVGATSDDCDQTDGLAAYAGGLGSRFPRGLLVCQDGDNQAPGTAGRQNFKYADLGAVLNSAAY
jgi:myo-inositol-hexaphosphate 3-phosphohydrolase